MELQRNDVVDLSVIMPCLNEEMTVGISVLEAKRFLDEHGIVGEVIVVDNGSTDLSVEVAKQHGAIVLAEPSRGYGNALRAGFRNARGRITIMGDCDTTYDFLNLGDMYALLNSGSWDLVVGNRYAGGIEKGAMPVLHKLGVRFLSYCGRKRYGVTVYDFHCGLRGFTKQAYEKMNLEAEGMEFATEMIAKAAKNHLRITEIPVCLRKCQHNRKSKLRTFRDGMRHLMYILSHT